MAGLSQTDSYVFNLQQEFLVTHADTHTQSYRRRPPLHPICLRNDFKW